jgi:hypothetical protein
VPADHPLRAIRAMTDEALGRVSSQFETLRTHDDGHYEQRHKPPRLLQESAWEPLPLRTVPHPIEPYKPSFRPKVPPSTGAGVFKLFAPSDGRR